MHQTECDLLCWMPFPNMAQVRQNLTIAATGASGAIFTRELLRVVECDARITTVNFIASDNALRVFAEELEIRGRSDLLTQLLGAKSERIQQQGNTDIGTYVASGSYPTDAMIVLPFRDVTLTRIANKYADNII